MNLDLSLILSLEQQGLFVRAVADADEVLDREEEAEVELLHQRFLEQRLATRRSILLEMLGVGEKVVAVVEPEITPLPSVSEPMPQESPVAPQTISRKDLSLRTGIPTATLFNYEDRGYITRVPGTGTNARNPIQYLVSDIPEFQRRVREAQSATQEALKVPVGQRGKVAPVVATPTPKDEEIEAEGVEVEPRPMPALSEAVKHAYHWKQALPVLEAGIEQAEAAGEVAIEVFYQSTPGNYEEAGAFVTRPFGQLGPGLMPFVRATQEAGKWSVTIPLRVESWLKPMAEGLKDYWRNQAKVQEVRAAATLPAPSSDSATRTLPA